MPYKSEAQRRFFNSKAGKEKIGEEEVEHWNEVSKGKKLPEKAIDKAIRICDIGESITYQGYTIVNQGGYWFIKGISKMKFPTDSEAIEWIKENR